MSHSNTSSYNPLDSDSLEIKRLRALVKDARLENLVYQLDIATNTSSSSCIDDEDIDGRQGATGPTGDTGPGFSYTGPANSVLFFDGTSVTGTTGFTYVPGGTGINVDGNIIPSVSNTYTLGSPDYVWKGIYIGPGTLTIAGPPGSSVVGTIGTDNNAIVYSETGFATPFINIGPSIDPLNPGAIGGWAIYPIGTPGTSEYDLVAQQKLPALGLPAGLTGPVFSLLNGNTGATGLDGLTGATGSMGGLGETGVTGATGRSSDTGPTGSIGETGEVGARGATGIDGTATNTGATGVAGDTGVAGMATNTGATGVAGTSTNTGSTGNKGDIGEIGPEGATGTSGVTGSTGIQGETGYTGITGATGQQGDTGSTGIVGATGQQGETGYTGITGATGKQGHTGSTGIVGATGQQGDTGSTGILGATGKQGDTGSTGILGATGQQGDTGSTGIAGATGQQGDTGSTGILGATGQQGDTGSTGIAGATGQQGNTGTSGITGATGIQGVVGFTGASGITGDTGLQGSTGAQGAAGSSVSLMGGTIPYLVNNSLITKTIGITQTSIYVSGPFISSLTSTFLILVNVCLKSENYTISLTVGRSSTALASNIFSTNIVNGISPLVLPQPGSGTYNYYMASVGAENNININLSGSALDQPGAGTFYYTIWMQSDKVGTFPEMAVSLIVLKVA